MSGSDFRLCATVLVVLTERGALGARLPLGPLNVLCCSGGNGLSLAVFGVIVCFVKPFQVHPDSYTTSPMPVSYF